MKTLYARPADFTSTNARADVSRLEQCRSVKSCILVLVTSV
jgi:hypothetical protein